MAENPAVAEAEIYLIMLVSTGIGPDTQWFMYKTDYFAEPTRVEWDKETMSVVLPYDTAEYLLRNGYARRMTAEEMEEYTAPPPPTPPAAEKSKPKKGERA